MWHGRFGIEHSFVEIDVDDIGSVADLLPRNCNSPVKIAGQDCSRKLRRTSDISAFTNNDESKLGRNFEWFEAGESERRSSVIQGFARDDRYDPGRQFASLPRKRHDVCRRRPATAADHV